MASTNTANTNYELVFNARFSETEIRRQITIIQYELNKMYLNLGTSTVKKAVTEYEKLAKSTQNLSKESNSLKEELDGVRVSTEDTEITFQQANMVMQQSLEIIKSMVDQVFELDAALIEFQKVSDLSGASLDNYVDRLSEMGLTVGRTG